MFQTEPSFLELGGSSGELRVHCPPGWMEAPSCSVWVEDPGGFAPPLEVELSSIHQGGAIQVGRTVIPCVADEPAGLMPWDQLPRSRLACEGSSPGAVGWRVRATMSPRLQVREVPEDYRGTWRIGLSVGRDCLGREFRRGPIWVTRQRSGVGDVSIVHVPGARWMRLAVQAGANPVSVALPWQPAPMVVTIPIGGSWAEEFDEQAAPIAPAQASVMTWRTAISGQPAGWSLVEAL